MACACGKNKKTGAVMTYLHTAPDGSKTTYRSKIDAEAAALRHGGTVRAQG